MKKLSKLRTSLAAGLLLGGMAVYYFMPARTQAVSELLLENVEALAQGEDLGYACIGIGTVDCPISTNKVMYVVSGYR